MKIIIINGPNLNMLGIREPGIYGKEDYDILLKMIGEHAKKLGIEAECFQSNHEGALVDRIQQAYFEKADGIVINPGAYTHTSVAILDAVKCVSIPTVEVHISDVSKREEFRQVSYIRQAAVKTIMGEGLRGYLSAMNFLVDYIGEKEKE
ncbi:MAG: type II 3-dehydroquinate dehydratase [Lachnospiraceae bacterium]|nr:type II 3-dehydroquinate dehydratase [Lachnospiraceae bacterium]